MYKNKFSQNKPDHLTLSSVPIRLSQRADLQLEEN